MRVTFFGAKLNCLFCWRFLSQGLTLKTEFGITLVNQHRPGKSSISMVFTRKDGDFHGYVRLQECFCNFDQPDPTPKYVGSLNLDTNSYLKLSLYDSGPQRACTVDVKSQLSLHANHTQIQKAIARNEMINSLILLHFFLILEVIS